MTLRVGVDLDGTLADLSATYHEYEAAILGAPSTDDIDDRASADVDESAGSETSKDLDRPKDDKERLRAARLRRSQQDAVWKALKHTPDFWTLLKPIEERAVRDLWTASRANQWEVFFITQRPQTAGATVQAQTQQWLVEQGFEMPSVLTVTGSRGKVAQALDLDFLLDDLPKNCVDVIADSRCRPILVLRKSDDKAAGAARALKIGVVRSVSDAIAMMAAPRVEPRVSAVQRVLRALGLLGGTER